MPVKTIIGSFWLISRMNEISEMPIEEVLLVGFGVQNERPARLERARDAGLHLPDQRRTRGFDDRQVLQALDVRAK